MRTILIIVLYLSPALGFGQKILLLEKANRAKTTKFYIGESLSYRLAGKEDYWYDRSITDMLPESNTILLDNFPVKLGDISELKMRRRPIWRLVGGVLYAGGATLALATTIAALYKDKDTNYGALYAASAGSFGIGYFLNTKRKLKLGEKRRLRLIEIRFQAPPGN
ncbi:MAG: hypothetical protein KDC61_22160 [Saprospiraceae bacterium]|nr:hypothetical protein [Saprospiraceae bacterium]MCB9308015.1 hypothetical protein [Lewinellaceae bacterium]